MSSDAERVVEIVKRFIHDNRIYTPEWSIEDCVYENAPELIVELAEIVGYREWDIDD